MISSSVLLKMRNVSKKIVEKTNKHFIFKNFFKFCLFWDNAEKYIRAGQVTNDNMPMQMPANPHSEYVKCIPFLLQNECTNAPECYNVQI
jgi:hypothetical protein